MPIQILDFSICLLCPARKMEVHHWCCVGKHEWPALFWPNPAVDEVINLTVLEIASIKY